VALKVHVERSADGNLVVVILTLEHLPVRVLWQSGSLVVVESRDSVRLLHLLLSLDNQVAILDANVNMLWLDLLGDVEGQSHLFATVWCVHNLWQQVHVHVHLGFAQRDLNYELAMSGHEADHLVSFAVLWQSVGLLELLGAKVAALQLDILASSHDQIVSDNFGLDARWRVADAVTDHTVLLWNSWHHRHHWHELGLVQPLHVFGDGVIELIEGIEHVHGGGAWHVIVEPFVHVEHGSGKTSVR